MKFNVANFFKHWRVRIVVAFVCSVLVVTLLPSGATTTPIGVSGPIVKGSWIEIPLSNIPYQELVGIDLTTTSKDPIVFASREDTKGHEPQIVKSSSQGVVTVKAVADTSVTKEHPNTNYGTSPWLFVETTRDIRSYLKFKLPVSLPDPSTMGTRPDYNRTYVLRLWALTSNSVGIKVRLTGTRWIESGAGSLTYNSRPLLVQDTTTSSSSTTTIPPVTTIAPTTTLPTTNVVSIPTSISSNCSTDVTGQIQNWIDSVPNSKTLKFGTDACYLVDGTLSITDRSDLTLDGNGSTLKQSTDGRNSSKPRTRMMFDFTRGSNLSVKNFTIQGAHPNAGTSSSSYVVELEGQHGFGIHSVQGISIENNQVYDIYGDDVYIGNQGGDLSRNVTVKGNRFERNGRQGIGVVGAEDVLIENNYIGQIARSTIDIEPNTEAGAVRRLMFRNNDIGPGRLLFFANQGAAAPIEDISFINNRLTGKNLQVQSRITGPGSGKRLRYKFIGNTSDTETGNPTGASMVFEDIEGLEVSGNSTPMQSGRSMSLVSIENSSNVKVFQNSILNGVGSLKLSGTTNSEFCSSGNLVGNPLSSEALNLPCSKLP